VLLERLTRSAFATSLVLKGGVLLAALDGRRPTRDIDLAASALRNTEAEIIAVVREIAGISMTHSATSDGGGEINIAVASHICAAASGEGGGSCFQAASPASHGQQPGLRRHREVSRRRVYTKRSRLGLA